MRALAAYYGLSTVLSGGAAARGLVRRLLIHRARVYAESLGIELEVTIIE